MNSEDKRTLAQFTARVTMKVLSNPKAQFLTQEDSVLGLIFADAGIALFDTITKAEFYGHVIDVEKVIDGFAEKIVEFKKLRGPAPKELIKMVEELL